MHVSVNKLSYNSINNNSTIRTLLLFVHALFLYVNTRWKIGKRFVIL